MEGWLWLESAIAMCACRLAILILANATQFEQDLIGSIWRFVVYDGQEWFCKRLWDEIHRACCEDARPKEITVDAEDAMPTAGGKLSKRRYMLHQLAVWTTLFFLVDYFISIIYITVESYLSLRGPPDGTL